jgi:hypothetical protein
LPKKLRKQSFSDICYKETRIMGMANITAQGCIAAAHSLPEITEKWLCVGANAPRTTIFRDFSGTLRCNTKEPKKKRAVFR